MCLHGIRLDPEGDIVETVQMTDISRCGLGVLAERAFYRGERLVLCLPLSQGGRRRNVSTTVVRCRQEAGGFHIGLEFDGVSGAWAQSGAIAAAA
jgi:hypothetical protein